MSAEEIKSLLKDGMLTVTGACWFLIRETHGITKKDMQKTLGCSEAAINKSVIKLGNQGKIEAHHVHQSHYTAK